MILIGVPTDKPWGVAVVTVTLFDGTPGISPDLIEVILIGSSAKAPTISHSGLCLAKPSEFDGNFWSISRFDAALYAFDSFA